ncbi:IclR family transcriptional regulator [Halegenticoccus tardaugens]|uniref:IclR family transcriptional regulator n=1 Tax=Halegenticoccus tardaugens TaxID=2071624 RepID=UPI00100A6473|nr:IclR family transcriptional regulator [Halegenticoccus tardaugens]
MQSGAPSVQATETSFRIIEALMAREGAGVTELSQHLELPKSTVYNHLKTLERNEYVTKREGTYDIGLRFLQLGEYARNRRRVTKIGPPEIDKLAEQTNEMANLLVEEHGRGVFVYKSKGPDAVHMDTHEGKRVHLHTTAFGKAIMAYLPEERVDAIIDRHGLPRATPHTITDRDELFDELEVIEKRGYAFDREERLTGLQCVAAPVMTDDAIVAGVSVSGPKSRMQGEWFTDELPSLVKGTANVIEINLTYS